MTQETTGHRLSLFGGVTLAVGRFCSFNWAGPLGDDYVTARAVQVHLLRPGHEFLPSSWAQWSRPVSFFRFLGSTVRCVILGRATCRRIPLTSSNAPPVLPCLLAGCASALNKVSRRKSWLGPDRSLENAWVFADFSNHLKFKNPSRGSSQNSASPKSPQDRGEVKPADPPLILSYFVISYHKVQKLPIHTTVWKTSVYIN